MNKKILIGLSVCGAVLLLFLVSVLIAKAIMGDQPGMGSGAGIGLVEVKGIIIDSEETVRQMEELRKNDRVKVVILRIESPGGVVGPSQEIYTEVKKLAAKKKVIASMGSVAASGGYYIAVPAAKIYANPGTITASIGVLMKLSNIEDLIAKVGMKSFIIKSGKFKDTGSPVRPMTEEDRALLQGVIDNLHGQFVKAVAEGRKLPEEEVRKIADGRIMSGEQALGLKLVDAMGSLQDAVEEAGKLAGIPGEPQIIRPAKKKRVLMDFLVEEASSAFQGLMTRNTGFSANYELEGTSN